ncbi:MAG: hypothetical protein V4598_06635 [Bdellovibrionota bacterium]
MSVSYADVMNLNENVPTHLEDASPVEEHATIFQLSTQFEEENPDPDDFVFRPDIRYGLTKKIQVEALADFMTGGDENQSGEIRTGVLYQFNDSENAVPIVSLNPVVHLPTGKESRGNDLGIKLILTSTLAGSSDRAVSQLHLNYELLHNSARRPGERKDEGIYAFGISQRIKEKLALIVDFIHQDDIFKDRQETYIESGLHQEIGKKFYLSYALGKGVGPSTPDWTGILSMELEL